MIQAVICDLDGTLLDRQARIRPRSAKALGELAKRGILVVLASGRSWRTVLRVQRQMGVYGPIICHNGAYGYDTLVHREWYRRAIPAARAREFFGWADGHDIMMRCYLGVDYPVIYNRFDVAHQLCWLRPEDRLVADIPHALTIDPVEIFLTGFETVDTFLKQFALPASDYEIIVFPHVGYREINIGAPKVDKVEALDRLAKLQDIRPEQILAIGDGANDLAMLTWAGIRVAVGDGDSDLQAIADFVTPPGSPEPVWDGLQWAFSGYSSLPLNTACTNS